MASLENALRPLLNREIAVWLNHHDLKVLNGRLTEVNPEHFVLTTGANQTYFVLYHAVAALRPSQ